MSFLRGPDGLLRREYSLAALLGIVTLVSILPFLLVGIYGLAQYVAGERADQLDRMAEYTKSLAGSLDRELSDQLETTDVVAASRHLAKGDLSDFGALARDAALKAHGHFVLVAPSGQQLVNTRLAADVSLPHTEDMESLRKVLQTGRPAVSELFIGAVSNQLLYVARVPVEVGGEIRYVLSFEPHGSAVLDVVQQTYLPDGWRASVIDGNGRIVARTFRHEELYGKPATREFFTRLAGPNGIVESTDLDGQEVVASYQRSALSNWRILIWAPKSVLYAGTYRVVLLVVGLAALTVLVSFAAALLAGRVIGGPARQLLVSARALGEGNPVHFGKTHMQEANVVGHALALASRNIAAREQTLRKSEQHTRFLMRELSHRAKNLLAVVQAIARQTGRSAENIGEFNERLGERLAGLARSQDLLVKQSWEGVPIGELVAAQLAPFIDTDRPRVATSGPPLLLGAEAAQSLGMALHELATNASKHGALSVPAGRVDIEWAWRAVADDERRLQVRWKESNGPPVTATPTRKGFGHAVIEGMAAASLHGTAKLDWRPEGLVWTLDAPESSLGEPSEEGNG